MTTTLPPALRAVLADLRCPVCGAEGLSADAGGAPVSCPGGRHRYDVARQGYLNLLVGRRGSAALGDDAAMVAARHAFLEAGQYAPLTVALAGLANELIDKRGSLVVDVGAGTAHHLRGVLDAAPSARGLALDTSAAALRRAARTHPRAAAVGADVWAGLPIRDGAVTLLLDVFSPRNPAEFARVLAPGGRLVVAVPQQEHLAGLVAAVGLIAVDPDKDRRLAEQLAPWFDVVDRTSLTWAMDLSRAQAATLVAMTPSARHMTSDHARERLAALPEPIPVWAAVSLTVLSVRR